MFNFIVFLYLIIKLQAILKIYQQSHYDLKGYFKYQISHFISFDLFVLLAVFIQILLKETIVDWITAGYILAYAGFVYLKAKKRVVYTKRIIRLFSVLLLCGSSIFVIENAYGVFFYILCEYTVMPIFWIMSGLEKCIHQRYLKKAKKSLLSTSCFKIAITGSYGKTSTKFFIGNTISDHFHTLYTKKSFNTPLGIATTVNNNNLDIYDVFVCEMGASQQNDISYLMNMVQPHLGVLTEIGDMHLDTFKTQENIIKEKTKVIDLLPENAIGIVNYENEFIRNYTFKEHVNLWTYGLNHGDYQARNIICSPGVCFDVYYKEKFFYHFDSEIVGEHNVLNLLADILVSTYLGLTKKEIESHIKTLKNVESRLQVKYYPNKTIIDDSFNANIHGALSALSLLYRQVGKKYVITSGFVEMKKNIVKNYEILAHKLAVCADVIILVGDQKLDYLFNNLTSYHKEIYFVDSFKGAYRLYLKMSSQEISALLIENDLPDIYRRGI